jgi:chemotaxis signal transduction protein
VKIPAGREEAMFESEKEEEISELDHKRKILVNQTEQLKDIIERFHLSDEFLGHKDLFDKLSQDFKALSSELVGFHKELQTNTEQFDLLLQAREEEAEDQTEKQDVFLVSVSNSIFAIPADSVEAIFRIPQQYVHKVLQQKEITLKKKAFPLFPLGERIGLQRPIAMIPQEEKILLVQSDNRSIAILVDRVLTRQEVEIGSLDTEERQEVFLGRAIVKRTVPVIDTKRI